MHVKTIERGSNEAFRSGTVKDILLTDSEQDHLDKKFINTCAIFFEEEIAPGASINAEPDA
jgi:hypothetical protein